MAHSPDAKPNELPPADFPPFLELERQGFRISVQSFYTPIGKRNVQAVARKSKSEWFRGQSTRGVIDVAVRAMLREAEKSGALGPLEEPGAPAGEGSPPDPALDLPRVPVTGVPESSPETQPKAAELSETRHETRDSETRDAETCDVPSDPKAALSDPEVGAKVLFAKIQRRRRNGS